MFKKVGMVTVGITAGLLAAAPFASAGEAHGHDGGHHGKHGHHGHHGSSDCNINGGNAEANGGIGGDAAAGALAQVPVGVNALNLVCSDVLNDNLSGNAISVGLLSGEDPAPESTVTASDAGAGAGADATSAAGALSGEDLSV